MSQDFSGASFPAGDCLSWRAKTGRQEGGFLSPTTLLKYTTPWHLVHSQGILIL